MSAEINENQFVTVDDVKLHFNFTSNIHDDKLSQIVQSANDEIKKQIVGVVDTSDIKNSEFFPRCVDVAFLFCEVEIRRQINHMYEESEKIKKSFDSMMYTLLEDMKASAPTRTSRAVVSKETSFEDEFFAERRYV